MSFALALVMPVLAQVGPLVTPGAAPPLPHQRETAPLRPPRVKTTQSVPEAATDAADATRPCPQTEEAEAAEAAARAWLGKAHGAERARAGECLGIALSALDRWNDAAEAFRAARAIADAPVWRSRLSAMAGEAALAAGDYEAALAALDAARSEAADDPATRGGIAVFRARALVALDREGEAEAALAEARAATPRDATVWLLSATLSRRLGKLADAQAQIEKAAELQPVNPEIGLEAGLIAILSGRDEAARKSWQSVIAAAPESQAAATAKGYLAQIDPSTVLSR